ncbi:MAG: hypothetical protein R8G33_07430 [Gammaproteobacteria bacterium]|nr:hypothetical protein [Gammaproteobacteria bacterium]
MSDAKKTRPHVPDGESQFLKTSQKQADEKGYVGYDTTWTPFQKEAEYKTPKRP